MVPGPVAPKCRCSAYIGGPCPGCAGGSCQPGVCGLLAHSDRKSRPFCPYRTDLTLSFSHTRVRSSATWSLSHHLSSAWSFAWSPSPSMQLLSILRRATHGTPFNHGPANSRVERQDSCRMRILCRYPFTLPMACPSRPGSRNCVWRAKLASGSWGQRWHWRLLAALWASWAFYSRKEPHWPGRPDMPMGRRVRLPLEWEMGWS